VLNALPLVLAVFAACAVEAVEALTIVLAAASPGDGKPLMVTTEIWVPPASRRTYLGREAAHTAPGNAM
jgi:hypothetical protein